MFYRDNRFIIPYGHDTSALAHDWVLALTAKSRKSLRHLEIATSDIGTLARSMRSACGLELATNIATRANLPQGQISSLGETSDVFWVIFRAHIPEIDSTSTTSSMIESVNTSILGSPSVMDFDEDANCSGSIWIPSIVSHLYIWDTIFGLPC